MAKVVVGVCGSVAAVRVPELVRELIRKGFDVECVMTRNARKIIHPNVLHWASEKPVVREITGSVEHVRLCGIGGEADLLLICPATSNTISKIACGIDDTTVTTLAATALASKTKIVIAPAMHQSMYENPFVKQNIDELKSAGVVFIEPRMEEQKAKLPEKEAIVQVVLDGLKQPQV
jgi:phosphopantothenoylcysteine decarboxylase/phosphopantothenate--cysteine ligase